MKNRTLLLLGVVLCSILLPKTASAKEYCELESGDGLAFGSVVTCGGEDFYVIDNSSNGIRLFSKYGLNVGRAIYREENTNPDNASFCDDLAARNGAAPLHNGYYDAQDGYCFYTKQVFDDTGKIRQLEEARSAHWDENGDYAYPQVGGVYVSDSIAGGSNSGDVDVPYLDFAVSDGPYTNRYNPLSENVDYYSSINDELDDYSVYVAPPFSYAPRRPGSSLVTANELGGALYNYQEQLNTDGYEAHDISVPTLNELKILADTYGTGLDYADWQSVPTTFLNTNITSHLKLREAFSDEYSWLWDSSYWLRTGRMRGSSYTDDNDYILFVDARGDICSTSFPRGTYSDVGVGLCSSLMRAPLDLAVRPTITIDEVKYRIRTETDDNGEIDVVQTAFEGDNIVLRALAKSGYYLKSLTIGTENGEEITFANDELTKDDEGRIIVSADSFSMPAKNVVIRASWASNAADDPAESDLDVVEDNPSTYDADVARNFVLMVALVLGASALVLAGVKSRRNQ